MEEVRKALGCPLESMLEFTVATPGKEEEYKKLICAECIADRLYLGICNPHE